tara:strand:- start:3086 stop:3373 length:288 start_codon:yes stop_codon:yes gene_type:complete
MAGASMCTCTGPLTSFEVPVVPAGVNSSPSMGQRSPVDRPVTGAIGYSENRVPLGRSSDNCGGQTITTSSAPISKQRRSARLTNTVIAASWWSSL